MIKDLSPRQRRGLAYSIPVLAVVAALLFGAVMLVLLGANPIEAYAEMIKGAFGSGDALVATILKATPLLFVGVGIVIAFRAGVINIGAEGQMVLGGLFATMAALYLPEIPSIIVIPAVLIAGVIGGALWGWIPGALKAYYRVNEILSTIMLNIVAVQLMSHLLRGPLIDPDEIVRGTRIPQTARLTPSADLPLIFGSDRLHIGPILAVLSAIAAYYRESVRTSFRLVMDQMAVSGRSKSPVSGVVSRSGFVGDQSLWRTRTVSARTLPNDAVPSLFRVPSCGFTRDRTLQSARLDGTSTP